MASVSREKNGRRTIQFVGADGKRRSIRLGKVPQRMAEAVKVKVEHLVAAVETKHALDGETARWVAGLDETLASKLAAVGLIEPLKKQGAMTLRVFLDAYVEQRADVKPETRTVYGHTIRNLTTYFGRERDIREITEGDAEEWARQLETQEKLSRQTARRRSGIAKQFFRHAVKKRFIERNPFVELKAATYGNREKFRFIDHATIQRIIETCPDGEWRAMVALARYGGLRCPSEILTLTWDAINWHRGRMRVRSPKTEHHEGGAFRDVPLFPELLTYLRELWEEAPKGENRVITRYDYNGQNTNLRTQFQKIIRRAGVEPWPKLWQNLRSTRETELAESFPMHVVCTWIGNSEAVARKHYLQVTDEHFARAAKSGAESGAVAVQNPVQPPSANLRRDKQETTQPLAPVDYRPALAKDGEFRQDGLVGDTGLEPVASTV